MSYSIGLSHITMEQINVDKIKEFCKDNDIVFLDESRKYESSDFVLRFKEVKLEDQWILSFDQGDSWARCVDFKNKHWPIVCKIADLANLFAYGEESEVYYIPKIGMPNDNFSFEKIKIAYEKFGYNIEKILNESKLDLEM